MPYVKQEERVRLENNTEPIKTAGNLNYLITLLLKRYWVNSAQNYQSINDIVGACEGAKLEFIRRVVNNYEDLKIKENQDVY